MTPPLPLPATADASILTEKAHDGGRGLVLFWILLIYFTLAGAGKHVLLPYCTVLSMPDSLAPHVETSLVSRESKQFAGAFQPLVNQKERGHTGQWRG